MKKALLSIVFLFFAATAHAVDFALSWGITDATGVTEYAVATRVDGVEQNIDCGPTPDASTTHCYTESTATTTTVTVAASPGQSVESFVAPCNSGACGAWSAPDTFVVPPNTPPAGAVQTVTSTTTRVGPPALP